MFIFDKKQNTFKSNKLPPFINHGFGTKKTKDITTLISAHQIVSPKQVHGDKIVIIDNKFGRTRVDGLITQKNNIALTVQTADCVPIIYTDKKRKLIGISHQGWRGSLLRLPQKMINQFLDLKSNVLDLNVAIGPSIGACCYSIDGKKLNAFKKEFPSYPQSIYEPRNGKTFLNLAYLTFLQLTEVDLTKNQIDFFPFCTKCNSEKFYSYRRNDIASQMTNFIFMR